MDFELISIYDLRNYCRVDISDDDNLLLGLAQSFVEQAQHICGVVWSDADSLTMSVRSWVLVNVQFLYDNRAALMDTGAVAKVRTVADGLLDPFIKHAV